MSLTRRMLLAACASWTEREKETCEAAQNELGSFSILKTEPNCSSENENSFDVNELTPKAKIGLI